MNFSFFDIGFQPNIRTIIIPPTIQMKFWIKIYILIVWYGKISSCHIKACIWRTTKVNFIWIEFTFTVCIRIETWIIIDFKVSTHPNSITKMETLFINSIIVVVCEHGCISSCIWWSFLCPTHIVSFILNIKYKSSVFRFVLETVCSDFTKIFPIPVKMRTVIIKFWNNLLRVSCSTVINPKFTRFKLNILTDIVPCDFNRWCTLLNFCWQFGTVKFLTYFGFNSIRFHLDLCGSWIIL